MDDKPAEPGAPTPEQRRLNAEARAKMKEEKQVKRLAVRRQRMGLAPEPGSPPLDPDREGPTLDMQVKRLRDENELLRAKLFALNRALIASGVLKPAVFGSPAAEAVPEERLLNGQERVVLAFGGMASQLQMPPAEFGRTFAERRADVIFYKDFQQCWYQQGLLGLSVDVPTTAQYIRDTVAAHGWQQVTTVGTSAGGYAAILFGALVGAARVVAFSPQTLVGPQAIRRFASTDSRKADIDLKGRYLDLGKVLDETGYAGGIDIYFGAQNKMDVLAAEWLQRFPNVALHPVDTATHNSAARLRDEGRFGAAFAFLD